MAELTPVQVQITGSDVAKTAADGAGETFRPGKDLSLLVANGDTAAHTVTVVVPGQTRYAQEEPDVAVSVPAGAEVAIGPFPSDLADPGDGFVHVGYDATTSVTRVLIRS